MSRPALAGVLTASATLIVATSFWYGFVFKQSTFEKLKIPIHFTDLDAQEFITLGVNLLAERFELVLWGGAAGALVLALGWVVSRRTYETAATIVGFLVFASASWWCWPERPRGISTSSTLLLIVFFVGAFTVVVALVSQEPRLGLFLLSTTFLLFLFGGGQAYVKGRAEALACGESVVGTLNGSRFVYFGRYRDRHIIRRFDATTGNLASEYALIEFKNGDEPHFKKEVLRLSECAE